MATQIFFIFTPKIGEDEPIFDEHIFQMDWFNHQLVEDLVYLLLPGIFSCAICVRSIVRSQNALQIPQSTLDMLPLFPVWLVSWLYSWLVCCCSWILYGFSFFFLRKQTFHLYIATTVHVGFTYRPSRPWVVARLREFSEQSLANSVALAISFVDFVS